MKKFKVIYTGSCWRPKKKKAESKGNGLELLILLLCGRLYVLLPCCWFSQGPHKQVTGALPSSSLALPFMNETFKPFVRASFQLSDTCLLFLWLFTFCISIVCNVSVEGWSRKVAQSSRPVQAVQAGPCFHKTKQEINWTAFQLYCSFGSTWWET